MPTLTEDFRSRVEAFLVATAIKPAEFGRAAIGDPTFVLGLRRGRSPKLATADRVLAYMAAMASADGASPTSPAAVAPALSITAGGRHDRDNA